MHVFFSGIGGAGIGPLALIAKEAGYTVSGSDRQQSAYVDNLRSKGIERIHVGQTTEAIAELHAKEPIDWLVYSSAVPKENPHHPELVFAREHSITATKRDDFINKLLEDTNQRMIAVAGTHGKTTTTAMLIWLFKQLGIPASYSVGGKLSFGGVGTFNPEATYFIYEADEYDRNFLSFTPAIAAIPGIAYDHPDIYPTKESYFDAFRTFFDQCEQVVIWHADAERVALQKNDSITELPNEAPFDNIQLAGRVNRINGYLAAQTVVALGLCDETTALKHIADFPGVSRRFEKIADNLYTDYAHTPEKIEGALQLTNEIAGDNVVVVYEGLHNTRQHFIRDQLADLFSPAKKLYIVPSYRAREDTSLEDLTPEKLAELMHAPEERIPSALDDTLKTAIERELSDGNLVLCLTAGGGGSLDEWLRRTFSA